MADLDFNELITDEYREAFAAMWAKEKEIAKTEVRRLLDLVSKPGEHLSETQNLVRRIFLGLVGEVPNHETWLQAVAAGSLRLRNDQHYVIMRENEKPARFLERGLKTYDQGVSGRQRWAGKTDDGVREGMHLIAFLIIAKELKNLASGPAALGPAWPLMVAVDAHLTNEEKRALHAAGSNESLQRELAAAIKTALGMDTTARDPKLSVRSRTANWRRELPPESDVNAYFEAKKPSTVSPLSGAPDQDPCRIEEMILNGPRPSFLPADIERTFTGVPEHLKFVLPERRADDEFVVLGKALRAIARKKAREALIRSGATNCYSDDFKIQIWLWDWVRRGGVIPEDLPVIYFGYLEEEACRAFEAKGNNWPGANAWRRYGIIGDEPSKIRPEELPWDFWGDGPAMTWITPPRKIDRIDVVATKIAPTEEGSIFD